MQTLPCLMQVTGHVYGKASQSTFKPHKKKKTHSWVVYSKQRPLSQRFSVCGGSRDFKKKRAAPRAEEPACPAPGVCVGTQGQKTQDNSSVTAVLCYPLAEPQRTDRPHSRIICWSNSPGNVVFLCPQTSWSMWVMGCKTGSIWQRSQVGVKSEQQRCAFRKGHKGNTKKTSCGFPPSSKCKA